MIPQSLIVAITFFYKESRLEILAKTVENLRSLADRVDVVIITNSQNIEEHKKIKKVCTPDLDIKVMVPNMLGHPFLLPWCHLSVFRDSLNHNKVKYTHFMYLEDDIEVRKQNILYWMKGREVLRQFEMYPSFLRYEINTATSRFVSVDVTKSQYFDNLPKVYESNKVVWVCINYPYQGMYLLDRELMIEHIQGRSSNPDFGVWEIREKAAQGLTFANLREGFWSRNLVKFDLNKKRICQDAFIRHLTNNYNEDQGSPFGKILVEDLILM